MKLHHTAYKKNYKAFILSTIEDGETDAQKLQYILDRFDSEYGFNVTRMGKQAAMAEWLSGLALDLPFYHDEIVQLAVEMGSVDGDSLTDRLRDRITDNYWSFMANIILTMKC